GLLSCPCLSVSIENTLRKAVGTCFVCRGIPPRHECRHRRAARRPDRELPLSERLTVGCAARADAGVASLSVTKQFDGHFGRILNMHYGSSPGFCRVFGEQRIDKRVQFL